MLSLLFVGLAAEPLLKKAKGDKEKEKKIMIYAAIISAFIGLVITFAKLF